MSDDSPSDRYRRQARLETDVSSFRGQVKRMANDVEELKSAMSEVREAGVEHRIRLENGSHVFQDIKAELETLKPKPVSPMKIVVITISLFCTAAGALWALSNMLRDRPTLEQVDTVIDRHEEQGHKATQKEMGEIREDLVEQRVIIEDVSKEQRTMGVQQKKIDQKIDQLLERRSRRRR